MGSAPYAVSTLSLAVMAVPVLIIVWRILKIPFRSWMPILLFLGVILLIQGVSELVGRDTVTALIYLLTGFGR